MKKFYSLLAALCLVATGAMADTVLDMSTASTSAWNDGDSVTINADGTAALTTVAWGGAGFTFWSANLDLSAYSSIVVEYENLVSSTEGAYLQLYVGQAADPWTSGTEADKDVTGTITYVLADHVGPDYSAIGQIMFQGSAVLSVTIKSITFVESTEAGEWKEVTTSNANLLWDDFEEYVDVATKVKVQYTCTTYESVAAGWGVGQIAHLYGSDNLASLACKSISDAGELNETVYTMEDFVQFFYNNETVEQNYEQYTIAFTAVDTLAHGTVFGDDSILTLTMGDSGTASFTTKSDSTLYKLGWTDFIFSCAGDGANPKDANSTSYGSEGAVVPTNGTFYVFTPAKAGRLHVGVILNNGKNFYIIEVDSLGNEAAVSPAYDCDGEDVSDLVAGGTVSSKAYTMYSFDVVAGNKYYVFCTGSKLGLYGAILAYGEDDETLAAAQASIATDFAEKEAELYVYESVDAETGETTELSGLSFYFWSGAEFVGVQVFVPAEEAEDAISAIEVAGSAEVVAIYNIAGVQTNALTKGINLVKYSDGSVKKVLVK